MNSVEVNDENQAVGPVRKHSALDATADLFTVDQPTGRPSILRQSQAENISKSVTKGVKVCFQTPLRDPVTKKIMSPSRVGRMASLDDCTKALESLSLSTATAEMPPPHIDSTASLDPPSKSVAPYPDDDMPIQSKGGYAIDFDNLDLMNPFQSSNSMTLSPPKPAVLSETTTPPEPEQPDKNADSLFSAVEGVQNVPVKPGQTDMALDETLPLSQSVENSLTDLSANPSADSTVIIVPRNSETPAMDRSDNEPASVEIPEQAPATEIAPVKEDTVEGVDSPLPTKGSYTIDFDNLDSVNPFQSGGVKIQNSPPLSRKEPNGSPSSPPKTEQKTPETMVEDAGVLSETILTVPEKAHGEEVKMSNTEMPSVAPEPPAPSVEQPKTNQMVLEFNFDDGAEVKRKPPPKRLGMKRPLGSKPATKKSASAPSEKSDSQMKPKSPEVAHSDPVDVPIAQGSYSFDFGKFDDPNFNPFGTKAMMGNSPPREDRRSPAFSEASRTVVDQTTVPEQPVKEDQPIVPSAVANDKHSSPFEAEEQGAEKPEPSLIKQEEEVKPSLFTQNIVTDIPVNPLPVCRVTIPEPRLQNSAFDTAAADEEFVPGSMFLPPSDLDGQIDYLEQFGSSNFKESALRKQSLYLKFDPLLKESPKKTDFGGSSSGFCLPRPSLAIRMMEAARSEVRQRAPQENAKILAENTKDLQQSTKLLEDFPPPVEIPAVRDPTMLDLLVPMCKQSPKCEDVIVDMLKYSQTDMDNAMEKARKEAEEREQELKDQIEKQRLDNQHMVLVVSEFEAFIAQLTAEHKQKEELLQVELNKVLEDKQQLAKDLNDMEHSFSGVVKRLDRWKEVNEGFKKNEEALKQCAQNYLAKLQKQEQRYQMLKTHAEEKIDQANKDIAEVRSKLGAEVSALQVQLRREQLKVQSLENNLEQKVKEVEDVTKLCDELIMKVQTH